MNEIYFIENQVMKKQGKSNFGHVIQIEFR